MSNSPESPSKRENPWEEYSSSGGNGSYSGDNPFGGNGLSDQSNPSVGNEPYGGSASYQADYSNGAQPVYPEYPGDQPTYPVYPGDNGTTVSTVRKVSDAFRDNAVPWVLSSLIYIVVAAVLSLATANVMSIEIPLSPTGPTMSYSPLASLLVLIMSFMAGVNFYRAALLAVDGHKLEIKHFFSFQYIGYYLLTSIVVGVITVLGLFLLVIPGLVFAYFAYWAVLITVDYRQNEHGPIKAIKKSFVLAKNNVGKTFLVIGISFLVGAVVGAIVSIMSGYLALEDPTQGETLISFVVTPIIALFFAYYYRQSQQSLG